MYKHKECKSLEMQYLYLNKKWDSIIFNDYWKLLFGLLSNLRHHCLTINTQLLHNNGRLIDIGLCARCKHTHIGCLG